MARPDGRLPLASARRPQRVEPRLGVIAGEIDYRNFKNAVAGRQGEARADVYARVWSELRELERG